MSPEGAQGARRLAQSLRPVAAAVAKAILDNPALIDDQLEMLEVQGLGDAGLSEIAREIIRFRLTAPSLDSGGLQRHLASHGFDPMLKEIARAAAQYGAPFLAPDASIDAVRAPWSRLLGRLIQIAALERAVEDAKAELDRDPGAIRDVLELKAERDSLRREIGAGTEWLVDASSEDMATLH